MKIWFNWKKLLKHSIIFIFTFLIVHYVMDHLGFEDYLLANYGTAGIVGLLLIYGFKYHIICCGVPLVLTWLADCKCHHKCEHKDRKN